MRKLFCILMVLLASSLAFAQFDPAGGELGSKAIHYQSDKIKSWGDSVIIEAGYINISDTSLGKVIVNSTQNVKGPSDNMVISLGDGGRATYFFSQPISDEVGHEFAIFENGFKAGGAYYLELASVEVSSDGVHFFEFESQCLNDTINQIAFGGVMDPTKIHNLAGKHPSFWGTPFDIGELKDDPNLIKSNIRYIRITDVVGSLNPNYGTRDSKNRWINDPWPTPFSSSGFDLDALALLSPGYTGIAESISANKWVNPMRIGQKIPLDNDEDAVFQWVGLDGKTLSEQQGFLEAPSISGIYFLFIQKSGVREIHRICVTDY